MQGIGTDGAVGAEHILRALKLEAVIGDTDDRGLQIDLVLKRDQLRRPGLHRPDIQHILIPVHIAVEIDLRIAVRVQISQPDVCVEAGGIGHIRLLKAGVEHVRSLLNAQHKRLLVILIPDAQQLHRLWHAAAVQICLAAADDLGADALEAVKRDAVIGDLSRNRILRRKLDRGKRLRLRLRRDWLDRLRVCDRIRCVLDRLLRRDDAYGDRQHLRRVRRFNAAEIRDIHLKCLRQLGHRNGPAVRAGGDKPVGQRDRDRVRRTERRVFVCRADRQRTAAG